MPHHRGAYGARIESQSTFIREVDGVNVQRRDGKKNTSYIVDANPLKSVRATYPGIEERHAKVPIPRGSGDTNVNSNDDTAGHCVHGTRCGQVL